MSVPSSDWFAVFCDVLVFVWLSASMMLGSFCVASIGAWIVVESFHNIQTFMNQNPNTTKQAEGGHSRAAAGSDYECGDEVTIEGHGTRTVNAQIGEYLFLDTDTDGPFIDAVHVSFVQNDQALPQTERPRL